MKDEQGKEGYWWVLKMHTIALLIALFVAIIKNNRIFAQNKAIQCTLQN